MPIITDPVLLRARLLDAMPTDVRACVERIIEQARPARVYAAGGAVRDAILGRAVADLDLVVEGNAIQVALAASQGRRITAHQRFGTATIKLEGGTRVDVATARNETYARPGALPKVAPADIETDLRRRDFTVNAIALRLDGDAEIIDPCGGIADLRARHIRVLHDASFRDDATRIFRAFRYAARLGFEVDPRTGTFFALDFPIEPHTRALIHDGLRYIRTIGGERLRRELELMFEQYYQSYDALTPCADAGALAAIHPALSWSSDASGWLIGGYQINAHDLNPGGDTCAYGFALMAANASTAEAQEIVSRLKLKRNEAAAVTGVAALIVALPILSRPNVKPSGAVRIFERYTHIAVAAFSEIQGMNAAGQIAQRYVTRWQNVKPSLRARDLVAMGVPEGPRIAQSLQLLRAARLDGIALDVDDERALVARFVAAIRDSSAMNASVELHLNGH